MRRILISVGVIGGLSVLVAQAVRSQSAPTKPAQPAGGSGQGDNRAAPGADHAADEATIRANIDRFVKAYNAGDAKAIAALFTPDGQIEDKDGDVSEGREAIQQTFAGLFADAPQKRIEVFVESIRFIGADLAVETGTTKETPAPNEPPEYDRYTVLHVKRDGQWQVALARDEEGPPDSAHERLQPLAWLVGDWVDDGGSAVVVSSCRWSEDGNFLVQDFKLRVNGRDEMNVTQRIGWDPAAKCVRSWVFDTEGGFGQSVWTRDDDEWLIKATAVRPDGTTASATNRLIQDGGDGYVWRSTDRVVGGEVQEPTEVRVVRKPPQPKP
ncbi:MAG TPA: SgcJ/EcaC family oxidoreductase [Gemmataceae bacterium]|jgi:uncharacterized protein (TIGR02246 family)